MHGAYKSAGSDLVPSVVWKIDESALALRGVSTRKTLDASVMRKTWIMIFLPLRLGL